MDYWQRLTCYPRRTFYPLSYAFSTQKHRVTTTDFRLCLTCKSHSQAGLRRYTLRMIADHSEPTFAILCYSLREYRPSKTTTYTLSPRKMVEFLGIT